MGISPHKRGTHAHCLGSDSTFVPAVYLCATKGSPGNGLRNR